MKIFLFIAALLFAAPAFAQAPACTEDMQFEVSRQYVLDEIEKGVIAAGDFLVFETVAEVDEYLTQINAEYGLDIPLGVADHLIAVKLNGNDWIFGYLNGCQIGSKNLSEP